MAGYYYEVNNKGREKAKDLVLPDGWARAVILRTEKEVAKIALIHCRPDNRATLIYEKVVHSNGHPRDLEGEFERLGQERKPSQFDGIVTSFLKPYVISFKEEAKVGYSVVHDPDMHFDSPPLDSHVFDFEKWHNRYDMAA